jgi:hypothetical protein
MHDSPGTRPRWRGGIAVRLDAGVAFGLGLALALSLTASACGAPAAAPRPRDQSLASRIAPTPADLGPGWKLRGTAAVRGRSDRCHLIRQAIGCASRFFALPGDPPQTPGAYATVELFASTRTARSSYMAERTRATAPRPGGSGAEKISLLAESTVSLRGARATLVVSRIVEKAPRSLRALERVILIQEGRGELVLIYKPGRRVAFTATARRIARRMRPARAGN